MILYIYLQANINERKVYLRSRLSADVRQHLVNLISMVSIQDEVVNVPSSLGHSSGECNDRMPCQENNTYKNQYESTIPKNTFETR